jgi:hypothetical protein
VIALARGRVKSFQPSLWLDGAIGALAIASLGCALLYPAIRGATGAGTTTVAVNLA